MKKLKRILSVVLVVCMIFTSQAFVTFAEGMENTEAIENETIIEETTVEADDNFVGAKLGEPEEETAVGAKLGEPEEETTVVAKLGEPEGADITLQSSTPDDDIEETDYPEEPEEDETEYAEEPEEDEIVGADTKETTVGADIIRPEEETSNSEETTADGENEDAAHTVRGDEVGAKLGELEKIKANTEDKLFGYQGPLDYIEISQYTIKTYHVGDTYDPSDLKIKAYYTDADTEDEAMVEFAYTDDPSRFSFSPDCVNNPFTESTTEENPYELEINYTDEHGGEAFATIAFQVHPASAPTAYVYYMKYNDTTKKYEDKYATIESGKTDEELNTFINGLWDTTFENRLVSWFVMSPTDPSKEDLASYDHFSTKFDYGGTKEDFKVAYNNWNNGTPTENLHLGAGFSKCVFSLFYRVKHGSLDPEKTYGFGPEGQTDEQFEEFFGNIIENVMIKDGVKGLYTFDITDPMNPLDDYNEYSTETPTYEATKAGLKQAYDAWNDNPTANLSVGVIYTDPSAPTTYTVTYNQNLPSGYTLSDGKTWYTNATTDDLDNDPIQLVGSADMTCEDTSGNVRTLEGWNTAAGGAGTPYEFDDSINVDTEFTGDTLTLYAVWSEPVAPGPTAFAYWKIDGDDANKTIHYYATAGEGRTAVTIDIAGIEYTGLDEEREEIKKAVIEEPIVATDVRRLFYFFKGLVSITDLGKLDTTSATSFESMFDNCSAIEELDVSGLETNSLTDTSYMFPQCSSLTKLTFGNYFDTSKVRSMPGMFAYCTEITELDLTSFDTSSVTNMDDMFSGCTKLKKIYVSDGFTVENVDISDDMFTDSTQLEGGSGTRYSDVSEPYDKTYAHIDGGETNPGFFSGASALTTYKVTYNQNLPSGYSLSDGKTWYTDSTSTDLSGSPIVLSGSADMTCEDTSGNVRTLEGWNTYSSGEGSSYSFGASINTDTGFVGDTLTLYAMWSDPVAPTTGFMYWKVDGDDANKTIHYYANPGEGRAAVVIGTNGVEHTSLGS